MISGSSYRLVPRSIVRIWGFLRFRNMYQKLNPCRITSLSVCQDSFLYGLLSRCSRIIKFGIVQWHSPNKGTYTKYLIFLLHHHHGVPSSNWSLEASRRYPSRSWASFNYWYFSPVQTLMSPIQFLRDRLGVFVPVIFPSKKPQEFRLRAFL